MDRLSDAGSIPARSIIRDGNFMEGTAWASSPCRFYSVAAELLREKCGRCCKQDLTSLDSQF